MLPPVEKAMPCRPKKNRRKVKNEPKKRSLDNSVGLV
ncbi:hypothetical protein Gorai_014794 [Gossypium raimondii]|uniref:Uncharacterized protein n=2 Tax=Gossypium raimondii TaxID=29730 RepID=A0A7J8P491_GOSRA|nr:hypothetical protein [Gossypium raimondii]